MMFLQRQNRLHRRRQGRQSSVLASLSSSTRSSDTYRKRWLQASLAVSVFALFFPIAVVSHEPVTTNVRFNKEIVRILNAKCVVCHSTGGIKSDIPLSTFEEARPWAKAIKEEVLEKRMPPYQAVKGFGSFHTDYGLSQRETDSSSRGLKVERQRAKRKICRPAKPPRIRAGNLESPMSN